MGIRTKLLLASLTLLIIPWLGAQYIQNLEQYLRTAHEEKLLDRVSIMAAVVSGQRALLKGRAALTSPSDAQSHLYVRPLPAPIQLDGYIDDWRHYQDREQPLGATSGDLHVLQRIGHRDGYLYIVLQVKDDRVIYRSPKSLRPDRADHLRISMLNGDGDFRRYQISAISPGRISAYSAPAQQKNGAPFSLKPEPRIKGEWQFSSGGYTVELRMPLTMIGQRFAIAVADVDDATSGEIRNIVASANTEQATGAGTIVIPSPQMASLLARLRTPHNRIWVIDNNQRVIGMSGHLIGPGNLPADAAGEKKPSFLTVLVKLFYRLLLTQPDDRFTDRLSSASRLDNPAITAALSGTATSYWRTTENENINITVAAHPIYLNDNIVGAIALEETSHSILLLQNKVIEAMANMAILTFLLTVGVLLTFATRLSLRIHRLRNEVDATIADDGRVRTTTILTQSSDEIGDLGRSFSAMLERLSQYNRYLETMSGKLSHELRTPITIVRSSLDNLDQTRLDPESVTYIKRANEGATRLNHILTRMSEATHLEQTILHEVRKVYHPARVVEACVEGYRLAYQQQPFNFICCRVSHERTISGSPELLAQLLDKLIDNATDYATAGTPITVTLASAELNLTLSVHNNGPTLPDEMRDSLFDSMVSVRQRKTSQPHLGLGLYIVRLISAFHHAKIEVSNTHHPEGVSFTLTLPLFKAG